MNEKYFRRFALRLSVVAFYFAAIVAAKATTIIVASSTTHGSCYNLNPTGLCENWKGQVTYRVNYSDLPQGIYRITSNGNIVVDFSVPANGSGTVAGDGDAIYFENYQPAVDGQVAKDAQTNLETSERNTGVHYQTSGGALMVFQTITGSSFPNCPSTCPPDQGIRQFVVDLNVSGAPPDPDYTKACEESTDCPSCSKTQPMAQYSVQLMLANLHITDTPIKYNSPRGPATEFTLTYNHREVNQPAPFPFSNFGPKWTFNWLSYVIDDPNNASADVTVYARGGGTEKYANFNSATQSYDPEKQTLAVLVQTASGYEKRFPDGSKEVFTISDGANSHPRHVFLSSVVDPFNNTTTLNYSGLKITSIKDSLNYSITLEYGSSADPLRITKVIDPFNRSALFEYYADGKLKSVTDPVGIRSAFEYESGSDFINKMTTPYGPTTFARGEDGNNRRWLEATDPLLGKERVEYNNYLTQIANSESAAPAGADNSRLRFGSTFYWNKKAMEDGPGDYSKAQVTRWLLTPSGKVSGVKSSEKKPLESRVWHSYAGQSDPILLGSIAKPNKSSRILDDGSTAASQYTYNAVGKVLSATDPVGRVTSYVYDSNVIDLLAVYQRNPAGVTTDPYDATQFADRIAEYVYDDPTAPPHCPHKYIDAARQTTTYAYEADGQIQSVTNARNETTTYSYGNGSAGQPVGYLRLITSPAINGVSAQRRFVYDTAFSVPTLRRASHALSMSRTTMSLSIGTTTLIA